MNNFLFDKVFNDILLEENLKYLNTNIIYNNMSIGIIPMKYEVPTKMNWNVIMEYCKLSIDKVIIIISNVSKEKVINRKLSKTNLIKFSNILEEIQDKTFINIKDIKKQILDKIESLSYKDLLYYCNNKLIPLLQNNEEIKNKLIQYLNDLKDILFKNINIEIDQKDLIQIFNIYAVAYDVQNKIEIKISQQQSPYNDMIRIVSKDCNNCEIYLNIDLQQNNQLVDDIYHKMQINNVKNIIIPHKILIKKDNNIKNLERENFPDKLTDIEINKIKDLLEK